MHEVSEDAAVPFLPPSLAKARLGGRPAAGEAGHQGVTDPGADTRGRQEREVSMKNKKETQKEEKKTKREKHGIG